MTTQHEITSSALELLFNNTANVQLTYQQAEQFIQVIQLATQNIQSEQQLNNALMQLESLSEIDCPQNPVLAVLLDKLIEQIEGFQQSSSQQVSANKKLADLMKQHNTRQKDLSHIVPQSIVSELVNGKRQLTLRHMQAFADYFNVPVQYFI